MLTEVEITSPKDINYNCFAWALGYSDRWWEPTLEEDMWSTRVTREETLQAYIEAFQEIGYEICYSKSFEEGLKKIAIYKNDMGKPTHAARQLSDDQWTSKIGRWEDVQHGFAENFVIEIHGRTIDYGKIAVIMQRPEDN